MEGATRQAQSWLSGSLHHCKGLPICLTISPQQSVPSVKAKEAAVTPLIRLLPVAFQCHIFIPPGSASPMSILASKSMHLPEQEAVSTTFGPLLFLLVSETPEPQNLCTGSCLCLEWFFPSSPCSCSASPQEGPSLVLKQRPSTPVTTISLFISRRWKRGAELFWVLHLSSSSSGCSSKHTLGWAGVTKGVFCHKLRETWNPELVFEFVLKNWYFFPSRLK